MDKFTTEYETLKRYTKALAVALGHRDLYTRLHSERVCALAGLVGEAIGLDEDSIGQLRVAASFHDIGKLGVPDVILSNTGPLSDLERTIVQRHSAIGEEILLATELPVSQTVARIIRHHHEWFGGGGYPDGLVGETIPQASRIIGIVDSYAAMAERRSYRNGMTHQEIVEVLNSESGIKHDPQLLVVVLKMIEDRHLVHTVLSTNLITDDASR
jgi:HD-GYP domain-containing protein (c-di-GMP phosphodiesterase class II)